MANSTNMLQLCRLCLVKDDVNIPIFEEQGDIRQIFLKISSCLPVKVSREDRLPKKICDGCSYKLDMLYEFWNTSANAEKQLLSWLGEAGVSSKMADGAISAMAQQMKPTEAFVKEETLEPADLHAAADEDEKEYLFEQQKVEESASAGPSATVTSNEEDEPPPKRARRTAAVKAAIAMDQDSDDDDDSGEPLTKVEDESEDSDGEDHVPAFVDVPSTSADDQPGPSGVGKDGVEAPSAAGYLCGECNIFCKTNAHLARHMKNTHGNRPYECNICNKTFRKLKDVRVHKVKVHENYKSAKCEFCDKSFNDKRYLANHIKSKHYNEKVSCDQCEASFSCERLLRNHQSSVHLGIKYTCDHCLKVFTSLQYYRNHLKSHRPGYEQKIFQCDKCPRRYLYPHGLYNHSKTHDPSYNQIPKKKYHCQLCPLEYASRAALKHHHARVHNDENPTYVCDFCGKALTTNQSLEAHLRIHSGEKPFKCDLCPKMFRNKQTVKIHRRIHTNEKPHACDVCNKAFSQKTTLVLHKRIHTGERPYQCIICSKKFITKYVMKDHKCKV